MNRVEKFEDLGEGYFVAVSKEHKFGTDAFLISDFAKILRKDTVADFGTGCGIISILLYKKYKPKEIYAFDILSSATYLAEQSVIKSNLGLYIRYLGSIGVSTLTPSFVVPNFQLSEKLKYFMAFLSLL